MALPADDDILGMFGQTPLYPQSTNLQAQQRLSEEREPLHSSHHTRGPEAEAKWLQPQSPVCKIKPKASLTSDTELPHEEDVSLRPSLDSSSRHADVPGYMQHNLSGRQASDPKPGDEVDPAASETKWGEFSEGVLTESNRLEAALGGTAEPAFHDSRGTSDLGMCPANRKQHYRKELENCSYNREQPASRQQFRLPAFENKAKARRVQEGELSPTPAAAGETYFPSSQDQLPKYRHCKLKDSYGSAEEYKRDCLLAVEEEVSLRHDSSTLFAINVFAI